MLVIRSQGSAFIRHETAVGETPKESEMEFGNSVVGYDLKVGKYADKKTSLPQPLDPPPAVAESRARPAAPGDGRLSNSFSLPVGERFSYCKQHQVERGKIELNE